MNVLQGLDAILPLVAGAASAAVLHMATGWWLNSNRGIVGTVTMLFFLSLMSGGRTAGARRTRAAALWVGAMMELTAILCWMGPGTLWPIVLIVSSLITASVIVAGHIAGFFLTRLRRSPFCDCGYFGALFARSPRRTKREIGRHAGAPSSEKIPDV